VIVDVANPSDLLRRPISADSALMNPEKKILALKCILFCDAATLTILPLNLGSSREDAANFRLGGKS
jgi:hypothetical protein